MATTREIMEELGLAPVWVLRAQLVPATAAQALPPAHVAEAVAPKGLRPSELSPDQQSARRIRIATLDFDALEADIAACTACGLCATRNRTVPGVGDRRADWLFVGEAPGAEEDAKGEPFVGQAGRLLDNMLAALAMDRGTGVYIANVLKCRPPANRTPEPAEAAACRPYLERQIALLQPRLIVALGRSAAVELLGLDATIAAMRGRVHDYQGIPLVVTYHPAYLLRNLTDKARAWEDLVLARRTVYAA